MKSLEVETALCILSVEENSMEVSKSFMLSFSVVIHASQNYIKQKCHKQLTFYGRNKLFQEDFSRHIQFHIQALFATNVI